MIHSGIRLITFLFLIASAFACNNNQEEDPSNNSESDRKKLLKNTGNNIAIPRFKNLAEKTGKLKNACETFTQDTTQSSLKTLRSQWKEAWLAWEKCPVFNMGPANEILKRKLNHFPVDTSDLESTLAGAGTSQTDFNLNALSNTDRTGFPALDYLLNRYPNDAKMIDQYTSDSNYVQRINYLKDVCNYIHNKATNVRDGWLPDKGNYIKDFINATGTDDGSSLGMLVNEFNKSYEQIKNERIEYPLGLNASDGNPNPHLAEAYFGGISAELAKQHLEATKNIYLGVGEDGQDRFGMDDYLKETLGKKQLAKDIRNQFETAQSALEQVSDPLSEAVNNDSQTVKDAYNEMQKLVVLIKTDMPSAMGVRITYQDNDGD